MGWEPDSVCGQHQCVCSWVGGVTEACAAKCCDGGFTPGPSSGPPMPTPWRRQHPLCRQTWEV